MSFWDGALLVLILANGIVSLTLAVVKAETWGKAFYTVTGLAWTTGFMVKLSQIIGGQ